jgi:POT family proton-dependent oligopeptide transporter
MTADALAPFARPPRTFFGEPPAIAYLAFTEAWERFSYYRMASILVLYMSQTLFMPGHIDQIVGFIYFTPVLGGLIAERRIGRRSADERRPSGYGL